MPSRQEVAILHAGLVTSLGLSATATCAAIRAALVNHSETHFLAASGERIMAAQVPVGRVRGRPRLVRMLRLAVEESLDPLGAEAASRVPILLCVAERERPGRLDGLDDLLLAELEDDLQLGFHSELSRVIAEGRVSVIVGLTFAREILNQHAAVPYVVIAAADSLIVADTIEDLRERGRLLTQDESDGFVPGEAAGALVVARVGSNAPQLVCAGLGFAEESATIDADLPLRADGLTRAMRSSLQESAIEPHRLHYRVTDNSGEQYYFKEAALAFTRLRLAPKATFDFWHPADCVGEIGAAIGTVALGVVLAACSKNYAPGPCAMFHAGTDRGRRAAAVLEYRV